MVDALDIGDIGAVFSQMRIPHPRIDEVTRKFNGARKMKRLAPYAPKRYLEFFALSHTGKSTAIQTYLEKSVVPELIAEGQFSADMDVQLIAKKQNRVVYVSLNERATRATLYGDILRRMGDDRAYSGTIPEQRTRVYDYLSDKKVELLVLDEIQHLSVSILKQSGGRKTKHLSSQGTDVSDALKTMMIDGLVPIAFVGVPEARIHFSEDEQLVNRELSKVDFSPIRWTVQAERDLFVDYCTETGVLIQHMGLLPEVTDLVSDGVPACLWAASAGRIGLVSRICEEAVLHASERGGDHVEWRDLELAVDTRAIPNGYCLYNPFTHGVRAIAVN
jgi:hypothetical protein